MARQIILSIFLLLVLSISLFAQAPDTEWTRVYGVGPGTCIRQISDGGFIISCEGYLGSIIRINTIGDSLWAETFDATFGSSMYSVAEGLDGTRAVLGYLHGMPPASYIAYTFSFDENDNGQWLWYEGPWSFGRWIEPLSDSGFILLGHSTQYEQGIWISRINKAGVEQWHRLLSSSRFDLPCSIKPTHDGGFIISASTNIQSMGGYDGYLIKTDSIGDTLWTKKYGGSADDSFGEVEQTGNGGFMITGNTNSIGMGGSDIWIVRTDSLGDTLWTRTYGTTQIDGGASIKKIQSGGYIISGSMDSRACLLRIDENGDSLWTKTFDGATGAASVALTSDGGYAFTGILGSRLWIVKLAPDQTGIDENFVPLPKDALTAWNYPNPFNSSTMISWSGADVERIEIFNIMGQKIRTIPISSNTSNQIVWNAKDDNGDEIGAGVYFAKVIGKTNSSTIKMIYLK